MSERVELVLPRPSPGEAKEKFLSRCMGNAEANRDFPDGAQRFAVCNSIYDRFKSGKLELANMTLPETYELRLSDTATATVRFSDSQVTAIKTTEGATFGVQLEEGQTLYAPQLEVKFTIGEDVELQEKKFLSFTAIPINPGVHKGFTFEQAIIDEAFSMFDGVNIVEHHLFSEPADVKGRVMEINPGSRTLVGLIMDPDSAAKIRSREFHSVSSHFLLTSDDDKRVTKINSIVELTLTGKPADEGAIIVTSHDVPVTLTSPPPVLEAQTLEDTQSMSTEEVPEETPAPETNASATLEAELKLSRETNKELAMLLEAEKKQREDLMLAAEIKAAQLTAENAVKDGKLPPAAQQGVAKLYASFSEKQRETFDKEVLAHLQVKPLGDVKTNGAGMVSSQTPMDGAAQLDLNKLDAATLEILEYKLTEQEFERRGGHGRKHADKYLSDALMDGYQQENNQ